jgi:hypothetical protein
MLYQYPVWPFAFRLSVLVLCERLRNHSLRLTTDHSSPHISSGRTFVKLFKASLKRFVVHNRTLCT